MKSFIAEAPGVACALPPGREFTGAPVKDVLCDWSRAGGEPYRSRRQIERQFGRGSDRELFPAEKIVQEKSTAMALKIDRLPVLPPGDVMLPVGIGETPLSAVIEMNETIPDETEIPALESLSVHANNLNHFSNIVNT